MKPSDKFDICLERVRECQAMQERILAIRPDASTHGGPPKVGDVVSEYIADFVLAGQRALRLWPHRMPFFKAFFVEGRSAEQTMRLYQLSERTFYRWVAHAKFRVGNELERAGLYPPSRYKQRIVREEA